MKDGIRMFLFLGLPGVQGYSGMSGLPQRNDWVQRWTQGIEDQDFTRDRVFPVNR